MAVETGQQRPRLQRLHDVVGRPRLERGGNLRLPGGIGQKENRHEEAGRAHRAADLASIDVGKVDIEEDGAEMAAAELGQRHLAFAGGMGKIGAEAKLAAELLAQGRLRHGDEDATVPWLLRGRVAIAHAR